MCLIFTLIETQISARYEMPTQKVPATCFTMNNKMHIIYNELFMFLPLFKIMEKITMNNVGILLF